MTDIILSTINARFSHASLGLRYLMANLNEFESQTQIIEFSLGERPIDMAEKLLAGQPKIIGFGIYIWNVEMMKELIPLVRSISPKTLLLAGGPEVTHHDEQSIIVQNVDYVIKGEGELSLYNLVKNFYGHNLPSAKIIDFNPPDLNNVKSPYYLFSDFDIENRNISVEASRGCPFTCEFCLSSLEKRVRQFPVERVLKQLEDLWQRGVRKFKFIDRTFNLPHGNSKKILEYFLEKNKTGEDFFLHFEMVPDRFPSELKELIESFKPGQLQFEIGIQSFNREVAARIGRKQNYDLIDQNLKYLSTIDSVHVHADLICGLPGEDMASILKGIDTLYSYRVGEIQIGILKRLYGAPINRHTEEFKMVYEEHAPYEILQNSTLSFFELMKLKRLARFWDLVINNGNFIRTVDLIIREGESPSAEMMKLTDYIFAAMKMTYKIGLDRLAKIIQKYLIEEKHLDQETVETSIFNDYQDAVKVKKKLKGIDRQTKKLHHT